MDAAVMHEQGFCLKVQSTTQSVTARHHKCSILSFYDRKMKTDFATKRVSYFAAIGGSSFTTLMRRSLFGSKGQVQRNVDQSNVRKRPSKVSKEATGARVPQPARSRAPRVLASFIFVKMHDLADTIDASCGGRTRSLRFAHDSAQSNQTAMVVFGAGLVTLLFSFCNRGGVSGGCQHSWHAGHALPGIA